MGDGLGRLQSGLVGLDLLEPGTALEESRHHHRQHNDNAKQRGRDRQCISNLFHVRQFHSLPDFPCLKALERRRTATPGKVVGRLQSGPVGLDLLEPGAALEESRHYDRQHNYDAEKRGCGAQCCCDFCHVITL